MNISIIVPVYNEERRVVEGVTAIHKYFSKKKYVFELIVVSDGSTDKTVELLKTCNFSNVKILHYNKNRGKGYAVKKGFLKATNPFCAFTDIDLATPIEEIEKLKKHIPAYDIVIASRKLAKSDIQVKQKKSRELLGKLFPLFVSVLCVTGIHDTQCGLKLFKTKVAQELVKQQTIERWAFDVELLTIARKKGFSIKEVPVKWIDEKHSKLNMIKDGSRMLSDLFRISRNKLLGKYE
ncbi:MAG: glycosyltransferase family 2 protein [Candidatus Woesearchaeota archaeon]|nr:MAG: glycosyltransferase family 2 protein [Candidatus Woesearchaeota archaeon]